MSAAFLKSPTPQEKAWIRPGAPALILAPMEGVSDYPMRALQSSLGAFTHTVTEFLRISRLVPPPRVFHRHSRELKGNALTAHGVPVHFQLLGGDPEKLAASALTAVSCGALGIDLNFGCPAPTVNRHDGGATLLQYPDRIFAITKTVREAVPRHVPVSVKMRLGWDDPKALLVNGAKAAEAGASWITVHGRTKTQGYTPPAYWSPIGELRKLLLPLPVVANGEIWTLEDFLRSREESGCGHFMLGRGALANPFLPHAVARELGLPAPEKSPFPRDDEWRSMIALFVRESESVSTNPNYTLSRLKQWLGYVAKRRDLPAYEALKRSRELRDFLAVLETTPQLFTVYG